MEKTGADAEAAANKNDTKALYRIVKELIGTKSSSNMPIKDKHGKILLITQPTSTFYFANETRTLPFTVEVGDINRKETLDAVTAVKNNKVAGWDEVTGDMPKHTGENLVARLTILLNKCWKEKFVPTDWQQGVTVKLSKKGDTSDCNNWRGITLLLA